MKHVAPIAGLLLATALLTAVTGCANGAAGGGESTPSAGELAVVTYPDQSPGEGDMALLRGVVTDVGGCFAVKESGSDQTFTPVFPEKQVPQAKVGDKVSLTGGSHGELPSGAEAPGKCSTSGPYWLVNTQ